MINILKFLGTRFAPRSQTVSPASTSYHAIQWLISILLPSFSLTESPSPSRKNPPRLLLSTSLFLSRIPTLTLSAKIHHGSGVDRRIISLSCHSGFGRQVGLSSGSGLLQKPKTRRWSSGKAE